VLFSTFAEDSDYILCGLDTLNSGYDNTPITNIIGSNGDLITSIRYLSDTIEGFSFYSHQNFSYLPDRIVASGVYKETLKSYILIPNTLYFNRNNFQLDSIRSFKEDFEGKSARIMFHLDIENGLIFGGEVQYSMDANIRSFVGFYNQVENSFFYKDYVRPTSCIMTPYQIYPTDDGGYLLATEQDMTYMTPQKVYSCILKIDSAGNEKWRYIVSGHTVVTAWGNIESANYRARIFKTFDGNYFLIWTDPEAITPTCLTNNPEQTIRIGKLTDYGTYGELSDERDLRSELDNFARAPYIINDAYQDTNGTMYVLMQTENGYQSALAKIHPNGVGAWMRTYICYPNDDASISTTKLYGIKKTEDGGFLLTGAFYRTASSLFPTGMTASLVIKTDSCGCFDAEGCNDHCMDSYAEYFINMAEASIFPNPARDKISVRFEYGGGETEFEYRIYNLNGQLLADGKSEKTKQTFDVVVDDLPSGYYTLQFWGGGKIFTGKFVKE